MTTEDDVFLKSYNTKKPVVARCSEDVFEKIMESFEKTAAEQSPFASVDNTVLSFDEMKGALRQEGKPQVEDKILKFAQDIYEHWKIRRQGSGNKPLQPTLKVETHQENDEADPYVCFRRREVRQTRKTRARDIQSTERLRKLRKELEEGRYLLVLTQQREKLKARMRKAEQNVFEKRAKVKDTKVKLGIKTDDEDLINQKVRSFPASAPALTDTVQPQKRRASEYPMARPPPAHRLPGRIDGRPMDADLQLLSAIQEDKENILRQEIEVKVHQHRKWNAEHVDVTREPLEQVLGLGSEMAFRPAAAQYQYLITPPSSLNSFDETVQEKVEQNAISFRAGSPSPSEDDQMAHPAYRRRMGRGGRLWIDRRGMPSVDTRAVDTTSDRWKFDQDDDEEQPVYEKDPYDTNAIRFRASIPFSPHIYQQRGGRGELAPRPASNNRAIAGPPQPQPPT